MTYLIFLTFIWFSLHNLTFADGVDDFLLLKMKESKIPGLQIAVVQNSKIIKTASYGTANLQDDIKVDGTTVFNLASITKAFTCVAVMQLVEQGKLDLSANISTYLNDLPSAWKNITVKQVLSHTSGLPDIMNKHFQLIDSEGENESWQALKNRALYFEPGTAFRYNQTNYLLAGRIIKHVSGKDYTDLIRANQLARVNMPLTKAAGFAHFHNVNSHQARDYKFNQQNELTNVLTYFPSAIRAGAGMSSNANELALWVIELQNGHFFEKNTSINMLWEAATLSDSTWAKDNPNMNPYALGWYAVNRLKNPKVVTAGGGQSALVVYPKDNLSIVILTNLAGSTPESFIDDVAEFYLEDFGLSNNVELLKTNLDDKGHRDILQMALNIQQEHQITFTSNELHHFGNLLVKHLKKQEANKIFSLNNHLFSKTILKDELLNSYLGVYVLPNFSIKVTRAADALFIKATGDTSLPIFSANATEFFLKEIDARVTFVKDDNGHVSTLVLAIEGQEILGKKTH